MTSTIRVSVKRVGRQWLATASINGREACYCQSQHRAGAVRLARQDAETIVNTPRAERPAVAPQLLADTFTTSDVRWS
ncbi:hypothetical protein LJ737_04405 [Hymenobacter sp. 15J16-1T3B]|uniref:hypothetical protein n=1 Tax=Hymenobacter sp. 15J16-1T3B TaxID=2886941 RepID=UPI001D12802A|nr:hypothetical protein [Hymenobacter sp. 15J16-1T3B]MCC3156465.1 hypothetical protein [Hymenobacter sp. 15J16-1T3B]